MCRKIVILFSFILVVNPILFSQNSYRDFIYKAYVSGNLEQWKDVIDRMEKSSLNSANFYEELLEYQYGYISLCIGNDDKSGAEKYLKLAKNTLVKYQNLKGNESLILSYKSAFLGFEIGINPAKAPFVGLKSLDYSEKAMVNGSNQPLILINYANFLIHSPSFMGGDKPKAIKKYLDAEKIMETDSNALTNNWLYLYLHILIAKAYQKINDNNTAKIYLENVLKIEPDFYFAKQYLLEFND